MSHRKPKIRNLMSNQDFWHPPVALEARLLLVVWCRRICLTQFWDQKKPEISLPSKKPETEEEKDIEERRS